VKIGIYLVKKKVSFYTKWYFYAQNGKFEKGEVLVGLTPKISQNPK
jgi:hypothetical protein